ncbi:MAG: peptidyl-prolyl cis-trans isomerase [Candidatus Adiutrix intracellularis]|nr:peptidyl-prolyl cis-trans isomerase [Candidatus Adiutrix intracellularis]
MHVLLNTNQGDIIIELDQLAAPKTVANFVKYVTNGHYNGTIFHRVIFGFMIQGGGLDVNMKERPTHPPIENEAKNGLKNNIYTVAMARTSEPHSATAQFFINTKDNAFLNFTSENPNDWGYAVFGRVVRGREVVNRIEKIETISKSFYDDVPVTPVIIKKAELLEIFDSD